MEKLNNDLKNLNWQSVINISSFNCAWNAFKDLIQSCVDKHAPLIEKNNSGKDCPWLTSQIKAKMNERDFLLRKAKRTGNENDWSTYRRLRNATTNLIRKSKANFQREVFQNNAHSPKDFWKEIKKCYPLKDQKLKATSFNINQEVITDRKEISDAFCHYFSNVGSSIHQHMYNLGNMAWKYFGFAPNCNSTINPSCHIFKFKQVQIHEVLLALKLVKASKATGLDKIPAKIIRDGAEGLCMPLCSLINRSLDESLFPAAEKFAKIFPVYKSGERSSFDNYRPISVLNILSKVIERIVYFQLVDYLEANALLSPAQFGFRRGCSTQQAVTYLTEFIRMNADKGNCTGALYLDLRKAFDSVHHGCLLQKIQYYGIIDEELDWFMDYLFLRKQCTVYDETISDTYHITHGVSQGSILGPLLFVLLINDMPLVLNKCHILIYADDTVLFYADNEAEAIQDVINTEAGYVAKWINDNALTLNLKKGKTEFVMYGTHQKLARQAKCKIMVNNTVISEVTSYNYLGVTLDNHLTFQQHVNNTYKKCSIRLKLLSRVRQNIGPYVANTIYNSMIKPITLYCYPVLSGISKSLSNKLESIQERAMKIIAKPGLVHLELDSITSVRKRRIAVDVFKSLHQICPESISVFKRLTHGRNTRGNGSSVMIPKVRTTFARKSFAYQGGIIFNELDKSLRDETSLLRFKTKISNYFFQDI